MLPSLAWREEYFGLNLGDLFKKSYIVTTLPFAQFLLLLIATAQSVKPESYLYYWAVYIIWFFLSDVQLPMCIVLQMVVILC